MNSKQECEQKLEEVRRCWDVITEENGEKGFIKAVKEYGSASKVLLINSYPSRWPKIASSQGDEFANNTFEALPAKEIEANKKVSRIL